MKRLFIGILAVLSALAPARAQYPDNGIAPTAVPLSQIERAIMEPVDNEGLRRVELESRAPGRAPHFALPMEVDLQPERHGNWEQLPDGTEVWRLRIYSQGAHSLNFGFLEYYMPPQGRLLVYSPRRKQVLGPFTAADNENHYQLWTPILEGEEAVLEVQLPAHQRQALRLRLTSVNHDFLDFTRVLSGACDLDVACSAADNWGVVDAYREAIQSVAVYGLGGNTFCTGFLVNNTRQDCTPYFITAKHCEVSPSNASSVVAYWNYQNSTCRAPGSAASGNPGDGQLNNFNTGAIYRAGYGPTDFVLLELDDPASSNAQAFFAGWARDAEPPQDTLACIHHPDGREKRISFSFADTYPGSWGLGSTMVPAGNHLVVPHWDIGSTASGSSGAPLVDRQQRVVGQLRGGAANCNNSQYDAFGWFRYSWTGGGTPDTRLKDWLDPDNTNLLFLDGKWLANCNATITLASYQQAACIPGTAQFVIEAVEGLTGQITLITSGLPAGTSATFSPNPVTPGATSTLSLNISISGLSSGVYDFIIRAEDDYSSVEAHATLALSSQAPPALTLTAPAAGAVGQPLSPAFHWQGHPSATTYELQVAADPYFNTLTASASGLDTPEFQGIILEPATTYYFRARGHNTCGAGLWTPPRTFTTSPALCQNVAYGGLPQAISSQGSSYAISTIHIAEGGTIASLAIRNLDIRHSFVGDLSAYLQSPSGSVAHLFHRPGVPGSFFGCSGANLMLHFSDDANYTQETLEATCNANPAITGTYQPIDPLYTLAGEPAAGEWTLIVIDHFDQDGGQLNGWELEICTTLPDAAELFALQNEYLACTEAPYTMDIYVGSGFAGPATLHVIGAPPGSHSNFSINPAPPGSIVTLSIDSIAQVGEYALIINGVNGTDFHFIEQQLEVKCIPPAPALLAPADEAFLFDGYPTFRWEPVAEADTFILQIALDPSFQSIVRTARMAGTSYTLDTPLGNNTYYWRVLSANACGAQETEKAFNFTVEGSVVGSSEVARSLAWRIFPNPTDERLHIQWDGSGPAERTTAEFFTIEGQRIRQEVFTGRLELSVAEWPAGLYVVVLRNGRESVVKRVMVE